ncbi:hypothetical protein DFH07DRAFT_743923 [Mycena maculata]|uniref:Uncharacterized protein n=1 Tax=Mycena maculata TaxID=230809 RepID=A0AAD7IZZ9_9AGAR|nr:hypothetical protein DFH07DRAFT_743923 [Mycena maculata]
MSFSAGNHSVTQSSFADPCTASSPGFDSGFQAVSEGSRDVPEWSFTVENDESRKARRNH